MKTKTTVKLVKPIRKEEGWMIIECTEKCTKWSKDEKARMEVDQPLHIFIGKYYFEQIKGWSAGEEREVELLIKTDKRESNAGNEFITYDIEFLGLAKPEGMFKNVVKSEEKKEAVPFPTDDDDYTL